MKKIFKWSLIGIVGILLIGVLTITFFLNPLVEKLRPTILAQAEAVLKAPVKISGIHLSLFPTTTIELSDASVAGGVSVKTVALRTNIQDVAKGELKIDEIIIDSPSIVIEKTSDGKLQTGSLKLGGEKPASSPQSAPSPSQAKPSAELSLEKLQIRNGRFEYRDSSLGAPIVLSDISGQVADIDLNKRSTFDFTLSTLGRSPKNIHLNGSFELKSILAGAPALSFELSESNLALKELVALARPQLEKSGATVSDTGDLTLSAMGEVRGHRVSGRSRLVLPALTYTAKGGAPFELQKLEGQFVFSNEKFAADSLLIMLKGEEINITGSLLELVENGMKFEPATIKALGGTTAIKVFVGKDQSLSGEVSSQGVDLKRAAQFALGGDQKIVGTLESLKTSFHGSLRDLKHSLNADFQLRVTNGEVLGVNIFGKAFESISALPLLGSGLLPPKYQPLLNAAGSTAFDSLSVAGKLTRGQEIALERTELLHAAYSLLGSGTLALTGPMNIKTQMKLGSELTTEMTSRSEKFKLLLDQQGSLSFPVVISRNSADGPFLVLPDVTELGKNAARGGAKEAASKALDKLAPGLGTGTKGLLDKLF